MCFENILGFVAADVSSPLLNVDTLAVVASELTLS